MDLYKDQLKKPHTSVVQCDFDGYFDQQVRELESLVKTSTQKAPELALEEFTPPSSSENGHEELVPPIPGLIGSKSTVLQVPVPNADKVLFYSSVQGAENQ